MIAGLQGSNAWTTGHHHTRPFVTQHNREANGGKLALQYTQVAMAQAGCAHLHQHFSVARLGEIKRDHF
jgi:hypothetical protein